MSKIRNGQFAQLSGKSTSIRGRRQGKLKEDVTVSTDSVGKFSLESPPGFYDALVTATVFTPYCVKIRLKDRPKAFDVKLKVSPVASKELD
jgi:hypothetical protein